MITIVRIVALFSPLLNYKKYKNGNKRVLSNFKKSVYLQKDGYFLENLHEFNFDPNGPRSFVP